MNLNGVAIGDPVVVDGVKYRLRSVALGVGQLRTSFGGRELTLWREQMASLVWDKRAGVWRLPEASR